jgi:hypothetical protein
MTMLKSLTIVATLLAGGASLAMAQNGPATGNEPAVAGGGAVQWVRKTLHGQASQILHDHTSPSAGLLIGRHLNVTG